MSIKQQNNNEDIISEINMTPFIDIMLVLLIIFMVTSSVSLESGLDIDLPKTSSKTTQKEGVSIIISIEKSGQLSVQGKATPFEELKTTLVRVMKELNTKVIILEGDQNATLGTTIKVMDLAKEAGAESFAIAAGSVSP